jgi:hypothetical protein
MRLGQSLVFTFALCVLPLRLAQSLRPFFEFARKPILKAKESAALRTPENQKVTGSQGRPFDLFFGVRNPKS